MEGWKMRARDNTIFAQEVDLFLCLIGNTTVLPEHTTIDSTSLV